MITVLIRRVLPVVGVGVMLALAVRRTLLPPVGGDLWFHLRMGHEFLDGWSIANPGHLGVFDSADWTPTQWLPQVALAAVEDAWGLAGVLLVTAAVHIALLLVVYLMCRSLSGPLPAAMATAMCFIGLAAGMTARPQVLSYILIAVTTWAWLATARDGRPRYWLVLCAWVWVPVHGMWPLGILISLVMAVGVALDRRTTGRSLVALLSIPVLSAIVAVATPIGWQAYSSVLVVGSRSEYFMEWGPPDFTDLRTIGVSVMAAIVLLVVLRRGPLPWHQVLLLGLAIGAALYSFRTVPVAAVLLAPLVAQSLQTLVPASAGVGRREGWALVAMAGSALAAMALLAPARSDVAVVPDWLGDRLEALPEGTRILNDWDNGAYLLWRTPEASVLMHGYGEVFTDAELERNVDILRIRPEWDVQVDEVDGDLALVTPDTPLEYALTEQAGWTVIEEDDEFVLLAPPGA